MYNTKNNGKKEVTSKCTLKASRRFLGTSVVNFEHHRDNIEIVCVIVPSWTVIIFIKNVYKTYKVTWL